MQKNENENWKSWKILTTKSESHEKDMSAANFPSIFSRNYVMGCHDIHAFL